MRRYDAFLNRFYLDAIFRGSYPEDVLDAYAAELPIAEGDLGAIAAPIDFLGVNNYTRAVVRASGDPRRPHAVRNPDAVYTQMGWEVAPDSFYDLLVRVHDEYAPRALYITENGAAFPDVRGHDGSIRDPERQAYLEAYLASAARAIAEGVPLKGYFVWSLLDNFEWAFGYQQRFGIVYVDFPTLERVPKGSAHWYRDFIAAQRKEAVSPASV
jgi:beta-glucosidase